MEKRWFYSNSEFKKVDKYIRNEYGEFENVFHEIVSPDVHLDVVIVPPTEEQPYYRLVTLGMGAYKMNVPRKLKKYKLERAEFVIFLPKDWNINSSKDEDYWPIRELKNIARLPIYTNSWLGFGHTVTANENSSPVASNTKFNSFVLLNSIGKENQLVQPLKLGFGKIVNFYQLYPLYQEELQFKIENSLDDLIEKIDEDCLDPVINIKRKNYCIE